MGLFGRRKETPAAMTPEESLRLAREGLAKTRTYEDGSGRRRKMSAQQRAEMEAVFDKIEAAQARSAAEPAAAPDDDRLAQLERLAALHASGALTDDEFAAEKARLLD